MRSTHAHLALLVLQARFMVVLVVFCLGLSLSGRTAQAAELTLSTDSEWDAGTKTNIDTSVNPGELQIQADGSFGARNWKTPELPLSLGSAFASDGTNLYVTRGVADVFFWKYSTATNDWTRLANLPRGAYYGADFEFLNGYVYAIFGGYQRTYARYSIANNSWEILADIPDITYAGASLASDGTNLYALRGNSSQEFYKYDVATGLWSSLTGAPSTIGGGADLVHINGFLYTPRGNSSNTMYRYNIAAGTWSTMANLPGTMSEAVNISTDGTKIFVPRQIATTTFYSYDVATNTWSTLTNLPLAARYAGVEYNASDGYLYVFRGNGFTNFWKYHIASNSFVGPEDAPLGLGTGSDVIHHNNTLYVLRGASTTFYSYNTTTGVWSTLAVAPATITDDTKGVAVGNYLYFFRGSNTATFYRYDIAGNSWSTLTDAPGLVRFGASLSYPGSGNFIYATRGSTTGVFWQYDIVGNTWSDVAVADLPEDAESSYGSRLASDGTDIYYFPGIGIKRFFKYTVGTNTWSELSTLPFAPYWGSDMTYYSGKILAMAGWYKNEFWEYTIATNSWRKLQDLPGYLAQNIGPYAGASIESDGAGTLYWTRGNSQADLNTYSVGTNNFASSGTWISQPQDLQHVSSWTAFTPDLTTPADSAITFETRTSADNSTWSGWSTIVGTSIGSDPARFIQIKATLLPSTGATNTPVLKSFTLSYVSDTTAPANPTTITASSQEVSGVTLTSATAYPYVNPYFSWSGQSDAHTQVDGFYVYFGTNNLADPVSDGQYQAQPNFLVTTPFEPNTYYLKIKTKDALGNISATLDAFTYIYEGVSPALSLSAQTSDAFTGSGENINTASDQIKLASKSNGFWLQESLSTAPAAMYFGSKSLAHDPADDKLYAFKGNSTAFYQYDLLANTWATMAVTPGTVGYGGGVIEGPSGYIFGLQGGNTSGFWKYNIAANSWSAEVDTPLAVGYGGSLVYDSDRYIYALRGNNDDAFWRYNTSEEPGTWESLPNTNFGAPNDNLNNNVYIGGDLAIDPTNQIIYAIQGYYRDGFASFDINTNSWTVLPDLPQLPYNGGSIEYSSATNQIFFIPGASSNKMYKYDIGEQTWSEVSSAPAVFGYGAAMRVIDDTIYVVQGNNTTGFYKYNITKDSWLIPNRGLFGTEFQGTTYLTPNYGSDIVKGDGSYYYIMRGNYADDFIRWDSTTGISTRMKHAPVGAYSGSSLVYDNTANKIYLTGGIYVRKFYVYDIATNAWSEETADPPPVDTNYGSSMVYDGSRYIFLNVGGAATGFYRFDTQGVSGSKWTVRASAPAGLGYGAELLLKDGYIYTLRGQNVANNPFYRYDIEANTWSDPAVSDLNTTVHNEGFLVDGGDNNFYATRGLNSANFFKYGLTGNSWSALPDAPARISIGGAGESNGSNKIFMLSGTGTGSYSDGIYTYVLSTPNSGFESSGSYITPTHDLSSVYKWANLVVTYTQASNTSLSVQTRSSADGSEWSSWTAVSQEKKVADQYTYQIKSPPNQYIQVKFILNSSDGIHSGTIDGYTINYFSDNSPPSNPETVGLDAYSDNTPGSTLVSGSWYGHASPYFDWPDAELQDGASDGAGGSGVAGYYVYFGSTAGADPTIDGTLQTSSSYQAQNLVDGTTYYLRIQAVDDAGNQATEVWQPFVYKFDSQAPSVPTGITADPSGYTATNNFSFSWQAATTSGALVADYCYKTGASSGTYSVDQCSPNLSVSNVPAYTVGLNTFSVRTRDEAGNYSAYATTSYYYVDSDNAPAPPLNLTANPSTNTENSFGFSWDAPATGTFFGSAANLSYRYCINCVDTEKMINMTEQNTTPTSLKSLLAGAYATLPGNNVFYIVTKDEAGNINYANYASVIFSANTTAPGIPLDVEIADVSVKSTSSWKLAISWEEPSLGVATTYEVYRSTDNVNFVYRATSGGTSYVDSNLTQQKYYYQIRACDSTQNCGVFSESVGLLPDGKFTTAADLISEPVHSDVTTKNATISWVTARTADSRIQYGTSSGEYFDTEVSNSNQVTAHTLELNNLTPGTTYYYVAKWTDEDGNLGISDEQSFTTDPPPSTEEPTATSIGLDSAIIQFTSRNASRVRIYYGETSTFGGLEEVVVGTEESTHTVQLKDLLDGTKYFFKINSFDSEGAEYEGETHSFTTLPRPQISNIIINQVKGTALSTLLLTWDSNTPISSIVTYYPITAPALARDEVNIALKEGKHQMILYELEPQTTYGIIIKGKDVAGNEAVAALQQVTTSADTRAPQISDLKVDGEILGTGEEATAQLIISYKTDEAATAQIEFGEGSGSMYSQKTQEDSTLTHNHLIVISELTPAKVYHLRAISKDAFGNKAESVDKVVITPKATENALDLVITSMSSIFGFLRN